MDNQNKRMELLGSASISKALLAMGIPTMIGMLINALYNLVDAYFVGGLGESQMGAISVVYPLGQVVVGLGLLFGNGAASYISRLLGRNNKEQANKVASTALYSSLLVGAIVIIMSVVFMKPILKLLGATESILPYAVTYASIYIISCIFNVFSAAAASLLALVALHPEGVDRNILAGVLIRYYRVALHPEGVDRNVDLRIRDRLRDPVALHPEGVDRNLRTAWNRQSKSWSPSTRRAWIEISKAFSRATGSRSPSTRRAWIEMNA